MPFTPAVTSLVVLFSVALEAAAAAKKVEEEAAAAKKQAEEGMRTVRDVALHSCCHLTDRVLSCTLEAAAARNKAAADALLQAAAARKAAEEEAAKKIKEGT